MFSKLFKTDDEREIAKEAFDKVVAAKSDTSRNARSARIRMALLCRAHLDKTFIEGAEKTAAHEDLCLQAVAAGIDKPEAPVADEYQQIGALSGDKIWVYLPMEYAEMAFALGARYQKAEIDAQKAIDAMQSLADQIFRLELRLEEPLQVMQFLRDELAGEGGAE